MSNPKTGKFFGEIHTSVSIRPLLHEWSREGGMRMEDSGKLAQTGRNLWLEEQQAPALLFCTAATSATAIAAILV